MSGLRTRVTLKDVALRAKCSTAVVSTIVNGARGNTLVSPETRDRVLQAAKELGYCADFASQSLARKSTNTLGIYVAPGPWSGIGYSYEGKILRGIEAAATEHGYDLLVLNISGNQPAEICARKFGERRIDGLILMHVDADAPWVPDLVKTHPNIVAVDHDANEPLLHTVGFDNIAAGRVGAEYLIELGHTKLGFVGSMRNPQSHDASLRQQGFAQAVASAGIKVRSPWMLDTQTAPRTIRPDEPVCQLEGKYAADHILQLGKSGPTAWMFYGDMVAAYAARYLLQAGVNIPGDLSIMGVDDSEWSRSVTPELTTISHPLELMGRRAVESLISWADANAEGRVQRQIDGVGQCVMFPPALVVRDSTARPARPS